MILLDCINRVPKVINDILDQREKLMKPLQDGLNVTSLNEIILCGSGTSNTCSMTSHEFVEQASGLSTQVILPNEFLSKHVYNPNALYIFTSQSGTSTLTQQAMAKVKEMGYAVLAITENETSPLAVATGLHVLLMSDHEEFGQRTIGYCASILTQMLIGMEIGMLRGTLDELQAAEYIAYARKVPESHREISKHTMEWFDRNKWKLMNKDSYAFYGAGPLWGVAFEGALKTLEIAKRFLCVGYEMDDGMHGPTMGFTNRHAIVILNDGRNEHIANGLAKYIKAEVSDAFVIGLNTIDDCDLSFTPQGGPFACLEYAPVVEILAFRLAQDYGIVTKTWEEQDPLPEAKYFNTHDE